MLLFSFSSVSPSTKREQYSGTLRNCASNVLWKHHHDTEAPSGTSIVVIIISLFALITSFFTQNLLRFPETWQCPRVGGS